MFRRKKLKHKKKLRKPPIIFRGWFLAIVVFALVCCLIGYLSFNAYTKDHREKANTYDLNMIKNVERPSIILDRFNREVGRMFVENRSELPIDQVPQKFINALVAGEDSRFFTHDGVDYLGIIRAARGNLKTGNADSGASTLTMQLARNAFPLQADAEKDGGDKYDRKFIEIFLSHRIEERFSKDQIMELYVNRIPFGSGFYGVRSAALGYFGKEPHELEIWECASLVGCIKNPNVFSPIRNPENNKKSRDNVLNRMAIEGFITEEDRDAYKKQPIVVNSKPLERGTSYFYDRVAAFVKKNVSEERRAAGGLKIFTTVDKTLQKKFETRIQDQLYFIERTDGYKHPKYEDFVPDLKANKATDYLQGAGLCYNHKTGEVLAYVGGRDFDHSQYDFIQSGQRPLGTAFLPVVYAAGLESGRAMSEHVIDEAMDNRAVMVSGVEGILAEWGAEDIEPRYEGFIPARRALAYSKIAASVRLGREVGLERVNRMAKQFGFSMPRAERDKRLLARGLIGSESTTVLNAARAYSAIGNKGNRPEELIWVRRIEDKEGTLIYEAPSRVRSERIISEKNAYIIHTGLQDVWKEGNLTENYEKGGKFDFEGGVKTGTTHTFGDHWALGYNGDISCAVWAGFFSGNGVLVCSHSGQRCTSECNVLKRNAVTGKESYESTGVIEYFIKGNEPTGYCDVHGDGISELSKIALNSAATEKELLYVLPVKPKVDLLLGSDPYGTQIPAFEPFGSKKRVDQTSTYGAILDDIGQLDEEAQIVMPRPSRMHIDE